MDAQVNEQHTEREKVVKHVVSTLKTLADATEGDPRRALERLAAKGITQGIKAIPKPGEPTVKSAARAPSLPFAELIALERHHGASFIDWEPETFKDAGLEGKALTKALALRQALYRPEPFLDWHQFEKVAIALNDREVDFTITQELHLSECLWAMDAMRYLDPETPWSGEVIAYVAGIAHEEGYVVAPAAFGFLQGAIDHLTSDYGHAVRDQALSGEHTPEADHQRALANGAMAYVNARHKQLLTQLNQT